MTIKEIMAEVGKVEELSDNEAMYYLRGSDEVVIAGNGAQPPNSITLRAGPDRIGNLSLGEIAEAVEDYLQ